ncbi:MAG TPA: homocysteine S-methyltransferase family protein [Terriglobia bacterium]|nr:homocysteine S-methyltransferase family protein [Terriglobia bacterium]
MTLDKWVARKPVLTDGAWGTELQRRGLGLGECPDGWNLKKPEAVESVAKAYVDAGSQVILTNTFRSNRITLAGHGLADRIREINLEGVRISRRAAAGQAGVFASLGPTGKMLMMGETSEAEISDAFREQAQFLAEAGADALIFETMSDLAEARLGVMAALSTQLPVLVSFVFDTGKQKDRTMMGHSPEQVAQKMAEAGAAAVGANCGLGIAECIPICERLRVSSSLPVWIKPNAGLPEVVDGVPTYRISPEEYASHVPAMVKAGATFFGGCCGTQPSFIAACARRLASMI